MSSVSRIHDRLGYARRIPAKNPAAQAPDAPFSASFFSLTLATTVSVPANTAPMAAAHPNLVVRPLIRYNQGMHAPKNPIVPPVRVNTPIAP